jgi:acetylornithine deacetylase/succinyl-diaminopimelate desuccinylase-like protein
MGWKVGAPAMTCSTRGSVTGVVEFAGLSKALHSGTWGGVNPDPTLSLCAALASLIASDGSIDLEVLRGRDRTAGETIGRLDQISSAEVAERLGLDQLPAIDGSLSEKLWNDGWLTVVGFDAPTVSTAPLAIQPTARAKINLRIPPGVSPGAAAEEVTAKILERTPAGLRSSTAFTSMQAGWVAELNDPAYAAAKDALETAYGQPVSRQGTGGTLPLLRWLAEYLDNPACIILGIADPFSNAHAVDESIHLGGWRSLCAAETLLIGSLAAVQRD